MIKGKCIYCKEVKDLNREHAFPKSLLQEGAPGWVIGTHLCNSCNSHLGKLDVVLSRKSPLAYIWERIQEGLGQKDKKLHSSVYNKRDVGVNPVRLFLPNPVYDNYILLHEFKVENDGISTSVYSVSALQPQIILTQYAEGQTGDGIIAENLEKFNTISSDEDFITSYDKQRDVYCIFGNTYIFPPKAANRFFDKKDEFKSKFIKDTPITQYTLRVLFPEENQYQGKAQDFCDAFKGEAIDDIPAKKFQNPEVFTQTIQAISDPKSIPEFLRAIAKTAFHCFLYHYPKFSGHESIFAEIRKFIYNGTPNKFVAQCRNTETADIVYDSMVHLHVFYFFIQGNDIGCRIDFFTGLLPIQFSYEITLAGNPRKSHPGCDGVALIPFSVHPKSQMKKRIHSLTELGIIQKPRWNKGNLWFPGSERKNDADFYNNRGIDYGEKGEHNLAIKDFNKAVEIAPQFAEVYKNRGNAYLNKGSFDLALKDFNKAIQLEPNMSDFYIHRSGAYSITGNFENAIKDLNKALKLNLDDPDIYFLRGIVYTNTQKFSKAIDNFDKTLELKKDYANAYFCRGIVRLHLRHWQEAKDDLTSAQKLGVDITETFHNSYRDVVTFERRNDVKLPKDIAAMLLQYPVNVFTTTQKFVTHDGKVSESYEVLELLEKFRNAGKPLSQYLQDQRSSGIITGYNEAFIVHLKTRDALIARDPSSAEILKPFLMARDIKRWRVKPIDESRRKPQDKWLIWTHRGIDINAYPAIKKHLEKSRDALEKRSGKQEWYEIQTVSTDITRFTQPKCIYADLASETAFAFDDEGYYVGSPASLLPTNELWILGVLNTRAVSWFYARTTPQVRGPFLKFTSRYVSQIPIPDMEPEQQALIHKIVEYILYLKKQPTVNSKDLKYARDAVMVGYFGNILNGLTYELYLSDDLHRGDKYFFQPLFDEQLPQLEEIQGDKMSAFRDIYEHLHERTHPIRKNLFFLDSLKPIRIIESKA